MSMAERPDIAVIFNPAAHKGGAARRWPAIQAELVRRLGRFEPRFTEAPGHATRLARAALAQGATLRGGGWRWHGERSLERPARTVGPARRARYRALSRAGRHGQ